MNIFGGMKILWIFIWDHHKIELVLRIIFIYYRVFSKGQGKEWGYLFWMLNFKHLGVLDIPHIIFFFDEQ